MKREHALYAGSRLYRQAEEASSFVLDECTQLAHPFLQPLRTVFHSDTLFLRSAAECASAASVARVAVEKLCRALDPYLVVPILLQVVAEFYYLREKDSRPAWVGTAAKIATAFTWSNVHLAEKT